jgi:hypothetical protein
VTTFPTGKPHISFSEIKNWHDCGWRHKLIYIDKINLSKPSENLEFGTAVHAECEEFLKTRVMNPDRLEDTIRKVWQEKSLANADQWVKEGKQIIADIPLFMDNTFPEWTCIAAEHALYENIEGQDIKFKGFIDVMIKAKNKRGQWCLWVLDWKTSGPRGWSADKRRDTLVQSQIVLYKNFCSQKFEIDPKDIKCGFVILKRSLKPDKACELIEVSAGPKTLERSDNLVSSMINGVKAGKAIKNRGSCKFCDYKGTEHCSGSSEFEAFTY